MSWPLVKLGDICETTQGVQITKAKTQNESYEGGFRYLYIADFISDKKLSFVDDVFDKKKVTTDDLVMANTGSPGRVFKGKEGILSNNLFKITFDKKVVDRDYLYLLLSSDVFQNVLQQQMKGGIQKHLGHQTISRQEIPLPPLEEQKRIAAILDKADAIRQKRKQAIDLADEFLRSVFLDMFGDPVTNPKGWEVRLCKDLFNRITVGIVVKPSSYYVEAGVPALRSLNIGYYGIRPDNLVYVSKSDNESILSKTRVYKGDLVIVRSGQPGKTAVVCQEFDGVNAIDILIATPKIDLIDPQFFAFFMNSDGGKKIVLSEQRGQVQKHFNVGSLNNTDVPLPPLPLQRTFAKIVAGLYNQYQTNEATEFNELFDSVSQKAFSGEL